MNGLTPLRQLPEPLLRVRDQLLVMLPNNLDSQDLSWLEHWVSNRLADDRDLSGVIVDCTAVSYTDIQDLRHLETWLQRLHNQPLRVSLCGIGEGLAALIDAAGLQLPCAQQARDLNALLAEP